MNIDDIGKTFGRLLCVGYGPLHVSSAGNTYRTMRCVCICGNDKTALAASIRAGRTTSCGCAFGDRPVKHGCGRRGKGRHLLYSLWGQMRSRCANPSTTGYKNYGGRGIICCKRWEDFTAFAADMGPRPAGHTLDRIDVNGNYEPSNCRWANRSMQANNTTRSVRYFLNGEALTLLEVAEKCGVNHKCLRSRLHRGWEFDDAITP